MEETTKYYCYTCKRDCYGYNGRMAKCFRKKHFIKQEHNKEVIFYNKDKEEKQ